MDSESQQEKTKRYLVFSYAQYYPGGGWSDFEEAFVTKKEARDFIKAQRKKGDSSFLDFELIDLVAEGIL